MSSQRLRLLLLQDTIKQKSPLTKKITVIFLFKYCTALRNNCATTTNMRLTFVLHTFKDEIILREKRKSKISSCFRFMNAQIRRGDKTDRGLTI